MRRLPFVSAVVAAALFAAALAGSAPVVVPRAFAPDACAAEEWPWPPPGPRWETNPEAALQRARDEGKGVFVYVATES